MHPSHADPATAGRSLPLGCESAANTANWLEDGRRFRNSFISALKVFADALKEDDEDEWGNREYLRSLVGKMYGYKAYQDIVDQIVDSATRNGKKATDYAPHDPFCTQVEKAAIRFKKDKVKELNHPDCWGRGRQGVQGIWYVGTRYPPGTYWRRDYIDYFNRRLK